MDNEEYYEQELRAERRARKIVVDQLTSTMILEVHEHRDQMNEVDLNHNEEKEKMADYIDDLHRHIEKLEAKIIESVGTVDTTDKPRLDISEMRPRRVVAYQ